ncbi:hypothetical protein DU80_02875 [Methanosarcina mazei]|uniref:Uncharacterized protein n=2 Tax=Methanosarcina mazei TaxID=2209 RepID=A0A0F8IBQ5_METMZ|nr:hypothetical protein MmTuc01_1971 [Methanosarcina mazei Tuc01]KKF99374.1 hypothetical protein DU40_02840 [Methanosarcina mazei]KKG02629.1 hypothetical protein DU31_09940 [Methanosarcina mazei]KKG04367.1 hypothetical protein DU47_15450 [Methanosarcina mazei]KKG13308.1 hypothetical protein DU34_00295 [Methanosarcina mazei]
MSFLVPISGKYEYIDLHEGSFSHSSPRIRRNKTTHQDKRSVFWNRTIKCSFRTKISFKMNIIST